MRRIVTALLISCGVHALVVWPKATPRARPLVQASSVFWLAPPAASRAKGLGPKATVASGNSDAPSGGGAEAVEWHSLGELLAEGNTPPPYPLEALERSWEGTVRLRVEFDDEGKPESVALAASSGHSVLDEAALSSAKAWRTAGGRRRLVEVPVAFKLEDEG